MKTTARSGRESTNASVSIELKVALSMSKWTTQDHLKRVSTVALVTPATTCGGIVDFSARLSCCWGFCVCDGATATRWDDIVLILHALRRILSFFSLDRIGEKETNNRVSWRTCLL